MYALEPIQTPLKPLGVDKINGILKGLLFISLFIFFFFDIQMEIIFYF